MSGASARGRCGEDCAAEYLALRGWTIRARNVRGGGGEIDLVAVRGGIVAFVEVKARAAGGPDAPAAAVGRRKRGRIVGCAEQYLLDHPQDAALQPRFDVAEVLLARGEERAVAIRYLPGAFTLDDL